MGDDPTPAVAECQRYQKDIFPARRIMFCGRCGHATGGGYGHYTGWCSREQKLYDTSHFCCPASCALVNGDDMDPVAPCHPAPGTYVAWAREQERGDARE